MVDSTKGVGSVQNIQSVAEKRAEVQREKREAERARAEDTVEVSDDAQVLSKLPETREQVANFDRPLGLDPEFARAETN